jgi:hypothetical protein
MTAQTEQRDRASGARITELQRRLQAMTTTVVILAVTLIGLGAWVIYDFVMESDTVTTGEINALLEDYRTAWNEYDYEAFLALVTDDFVHEYAGFSSDAQATAADIESAEAFENNIETVGDPVMSGEGPEYYVAQADVLTSEGETALEGISIFTIVQDGDTYKIRHHVFVGQ